MVTLPLDTKERNYSFEVPLDNEMFKFRFLWNPRAEAWFFDLIQSSSGDTLVSQRRVTTGAFLLRQFVGPQWPKGELLVLDTTDTDADPGETDLGDRVKIVYLEALKGEVTSRV